MINRERLVLLADRDALLRLDGLVQSLGPAPTLEDAPGELVDDHDLAVDHGVVLVGVVERLGLERLDEVVDEVAVLGQVQVLDADELLGLCDSARCRRDRLVLLVVLVVPLGIALGLLLGLRRLHPRNAFELAREPRELHVPVGRLLGGARDDQRRARFVDQDVVDLVDDPERMAALDQLLERRRHVVAQVVEPNSELVP